MANPTAMLLCASNLLDHVNLDFYGEKIRHAVDRVIKAGKVNYSKLFLIYFGEILFLNNILDSRGV